MIAARKNRAFNAAVRLWVGRMLRRRFHNIHVAGGEHLRGLAAGKPVVGCINHSNWWDGFVLQVLSNRLAPARGMFLAMEEKNLRRYPFFRWLGVFGIDLDGPRAALPGLRYAVRLLRGGSGRLLWIFAPGRLQPAHQPIEAKGGGPFLARAAGAALLPAVLRYEWLGESRPSIFVRFGAPLPADAGADALAAALNGLYEQAGAALDPPDLSGYRPLFAPRMSMNKRWDYFVHLLLRRRAPFDKQNG